MATYVRFRKKLGPDCKFVTTAAKTMYMFELKRFPKLDQWIENNDWTEYS